MPTPAATSQPFLSAGQIQTLFNLGAAALTFLGVAAFAAAAWVLVPKAVLYGRMRAAEARNAMLEGALTALAPAMTEMRNEIAALSAKVSLSSSAAADARAEAQAARAEALEGRTLLLLSLRHIADLVKWGRSRKPVAEMPALPAEIDAQLRAHDLEIESAAPASS